MPPGPEWVKVVVSRLGEVIVVLPHLDGDDDGDEVVVLPHRGNR